MKIKNIALVGNPNCGKTSLFNTLTGTRQKVANYAGVTVERKEGSFKLPSGDAIRVLDLPGTYSLKPSNLSSMKYFSFLASFGKLAYLDLSNKPL